MENDNEYKVNFLSLVLCKIDFNAVLEDSSKKYLELTELLSKKFPIKEMQNAQENAVTVNGTRKPRVSQRFFTKVSFTNIERTQVITIVDRSIIVEFKKYDSYTTFKDVVSELTDSLNKLYPDTIAQRIGLRYVNEIRIGSGKWDNWKNIINKSLIINPNLNAGTADTARAMSAIEYLDTTDDYMLKFQYGMPNQDYPAPIRNRLFVLDYDCFTQAPKNVSDIDCTIDKFHDYIENLFKQSIGAELDNVMRNEG